MFVIRYLVWIFRIVMFVLLLGFAIKNDEVVSVHFYLNTEWQLPLILVMLAFFALGILLGVSVAIMPLLKQRRELRGLRRAEDQNNRPLQAPLTHPRRKSDQAEIY